MTGIQLVKLEAIRNEEYNSAITFSKGLNIIEGPSNTGKTLIIEAVKFCMGLTDEISNRGYDGFRLELSAEYGNFKIKRMVGDSVVYVESDNPNISNGDYTVGSSINDIGDVLLRCIGANPKTLLITGSDYSTAKLTWNRLMKFCIFGESNIINRESIVCTGGNFSNTLLLSLLRFLYTGKQEEIKEKICSQKERALINRGRDELFYETMEQLEQECKSIQEEFADLQGRNIKECIKNVVFQIAAVERKCSQAINSYQSLVSKIMDLDKKISELQSLQERYSVLVSQYNGDIGRCELIIEGKRALEEHSINLACPFCGHSLTPEKEKINIEMAKREKLRIAAILKDVGEAIYNNQKNIEKLFHEKEKLTSECKSFKETIEGQYKLQCDNLKKEYDHYIEYTVKQEYIRKYKEASEQKHPLLQPEPENISNEPYNPHDDFETDIAIKLDKYVKEMFAECGYEETKNIEFDIKKFDVRIDGNSKWINNGKGYRAFVNTLVALSFRHLFANDMKIAPRFLMIDSPLLGLQEPDKVAISKKRCLFEYVLKHQDEGQVIMMENDINIPVLEYEQRGANVIQFTHSNTGRYGFLDGVGD